MWGRRLAIIGLTCAAPAATAAATLPISGDFGNDLGCELARTGEYNPVEGVYLLTPDRLATSVSVCLFETVRAAPSGGFDVSLSCGDEGDTEEARDSALITGNEAAGYTVRFANGTTWGPLRRC